MCACALSYDWNISSNHISLSTTHKGNIMLTYAFIFFVIAVIAGLLGFKGVESGATKIAKLFFFIFIVLALLVVAAAVLGISLIF